MVIGNLQLVIIKPTSCKYYFLKMICAAEKLEKFCKK